MVWVDVLFVVSALLAALQLIPLLAGRGKAAPSLTQVLLAYWRRRAWRIVPAYAVANLLAAVALGPAEVTWEAAAARWLHFYHCPRTLWANALFLQNWLGNQACGEPATFAFCPLPGHHSACLRAALPRRAAPHLQPCPP